MQARQEGGGGGVGQLSRAPAYGGPRKEEAKPKCCTHHAFWAGTVRPFFNIIIKKTYF